MAEEFTARFKVDISDLKKNITEANRQIKLADATFKASSAGMDKWADNADGLNAKLKSLRKTLDNQNSIQEAHEQALERVNKAYDENGRRAEALKAKMRELVSNGVEKTSDEYKKYEDALKNVLKEQDNNKKSANQLELAILKDKAAVGNTERDIRHYETSLTELENTADDAGEEVKDLGDETKKSGDKAEKGSKGYTVFKGILADLAASAIKAAAEGVKKLGEGILEIGKQALSGYAEMEQLQGGVEKLFGSDAVAVINNANNAYKTAGMNANEYMETVTSFSASLIASLGDDTAAAAQYADMAISDMSDNANTFGSDVGTIQSAYQGFAKQNYTMLDNLKLGYGGTKTEMQRLVKDAMKLDKSFKAQTDDAGEVALAYSDIIQAIHIMQKNMNIAGTTAREASKTIEGSINSTKAAWQNLINNLGNPEADIKELARNVISSASDVLSNVIPIIGNIVDAVPSALTEIIAAIKDADLVGVVVKAAEDIATSLFESLPSMVEELGSTLAELLPSAVNTLSEGLPAIVTSIADAIGTLIESLDIGSLVKSVFGALNNITEAIVPRLPELLIQLISGIVEALPDLFVGVGETIYNIFDGLFAGYDQFDQTKAVLDRQSDAWDNVVSAMQKNADEIDAEAGTWQSAWGMLQNITDESGNVKKGYEQMASALVDQLNGALGLNIEIVKGQIKDYETLGDKIDYLIEKKRAELILENEEQGYAEALKMRPELVDAVTTATDAYNAALEAQEEAQRAYNSAAESSPETLGFLQSALDKATQDVANMADALDTAESNLAENTSVMSKYMDDYTAVMQGDYNSLGTSTKKYAGDTKAELEAYKNDVQRQLNQDTKNHEAWLADYKKTNSDYSKEQADYYARRIETDESKLSAINELVEGKGEDFSAGYVNGILSGEGDVDSAAEKITKGAIDTVGKTQQSQSPSRVADGLGRYFGEGYANGIESESGSVSSSASGLASDAKSGLESQEGAAYTAGKNTGSGFADGIGAMSGYVWSSAKSIASSALDSIKNFLGIHSPSKVTEWLGEMVAQGLADGISNNTAAAVKEAVNMADEVKGAIHISGSDVKAAVSGLHDTSAGARLGGTSYTQIINSPKAPSRLEIYRQTKNLLGLAGAK